MLINDRSCRTHSAHWKADWSVLCLSLVIVVIWCIYGASRFQLSLLWTGGCCELRSVAVRRQFDCFPTSPDEGEDGRSGTGIYQKAELVQKVGEGRGSTPIRDSDPHFPCSPEGSRGGHWHHSRRWARLRSCHPTTNPVPKGVGRPPLIILTTSINLLKLQGEMKAFMKGTFEFRSTRNGINGVTKDMANYSTLMRHLDARKVPYYMFHTKSLKPVNVFIRQLPGDTAIAEI